MANGYLIPTGLFLSGLLIALLFFYFLVKFRTSVARKRGDYLVLELPIFGRIKTNFRLNREGLSVDEWIELRGKLEDLNRILDPEFVFHYAKEYNIRYIGTEGDKDDKTWSKGRLAYSALSGLETGGYNVFLNPSLDCTDVARRLSLELGEVIYPSEVQAFLFLHEIGHTRKAGNQDYFTAVVNYSISGGKHAAKRRSELVHLKRKIESYADQFALSELKKWRKNDRQWMVRS